MIFFLLWNNSFSKETSSASRTPKEHCTLDIENGNTTENVAKVLNERVIFYFSSNCQALKLKLTLKWILGNGTKAHKAIILGKRMAGFFFFPDKRKEKGRAQSKTECQVLFLSCLFRCGTDRKILGGQDGRKRCQKMNNSYRKLW